MANQKIQEIAEQIYATTPEIAKEMPIQNSKILKGLLGGSGNPDLKRVHDQAKENMMRVQAPEWEALYQDKLTELDDVKKDTHKLKENTIKRQERYIKRE